MPSLEVFGDRQRGSKHHIQSQSPFKQNVKLSTWLHRRKCVDLHNTTLSPSQTSSSRLTMGSSVQCQ